MCRCKANKVAADALRMILPELLERHISVTEDYDLADPSINADVGKLEQVLINLLINSSQAMDDGGTIRLRTRCLTISGLTPDPGLREMDLLKDGDQAVIIEIRDSGPGIPADLMNRVFEPFFTTKPTGQGTGLGLPVAKRIIELHRGVLHVKNALLPPGLSVRITLKADIEDAPL
jgi:signal transduction histidine kinase